MTPRLRAALGAAAFVATGGAVALAQMATADRVQTPGFWPTKGSAPRADYLGPAACARCHAAHAESQSRTSMARTAMRAADSGPARSTALRFESGGYTYEVTGGTGPPMFRVSHGGQSASAPLAWAFGAGKVGQSYLFDKDGALHEARLSYFDSIHGADFTPTRAVASPRDLAEAMSRPVPDAEARRCFGCHTTASTVEGRFDRADPIAGVTCEACHGPGRAHVAAIEQKKLGAGIDAIFNPARLDPAAKVDFCGACHATFWDVKLANERGIAALRSQPNRLQSSRCWGSGDARITCVACHDPHEPLVREAAFYDDKCLACHVARGAAPAADHPGRSCPVAATQCVTCHMPKYDAPGMHHEFTDHLIRVVAAKR